MEEELLECLLCGGEAFYEYLEEGAYARHKVHKAECKKCGLHVQHISKDEMIIGWNDGDFTMIPRWVKCHAVNSIIADSLENKTNRLNRQ